MCDSVIYLEILVRIYPFRFIVMNFSAAKVKAVGHACNKDLTLPIYIAHRIYKYVFIYWWKLVVYAVPATVFHAAFCPIYHGHSVANWFIHHLINAFFD